MWSRTSGPAGVRPPAVAGSWYPGEANALRSLVEGLLAAAPRASPARGPLRALVVPHAGIVYSGRTAAHGYARIQSGDFERVVVLAPSHRVPLRGVAVDPSTHYQTPLGPMPVDADAVTALGARPEFECDARPFALEHAIEMQLPFLQIVLPQARLVPVLVGELRGEEFAAVAADVAALADPGTLLVVSSDFVHYGANYSYVPFTDRVPERIRALDGEAIEAIQAHDGARFQEHLSRTGATICGRRPLGVLLEMVRPEWRADLCDYTTSGEITGDWTHSVSYACLAFHEDVDARASVGAGMGEERSAGGFDAESRAAGADTESPAGRRTEVRPAIAAVPALSPEERRVLLVVARQTLEALFEPPALETRLAAIERTARLLEPSGAFVSLHRRRDGRLRGCIGTLAPRRPLLDAVIENARAAATNDPRFPPLGAEELDAHEVEISVIGPLIPAVPEEIVVGRDGVVVTQGSERGVLLPQVATSQRWSREQFLENVCRKANLAPDAWRGDATLERFEAIVFGEAS